jgi:FkbM family methyltransferase
MQLLFRTLYRLYIQAPNHPAKLRIEKWISDMIFPNEGAIFEVDRKIKLYLHPKDYIEYLLLKTGSYEPLTLDFIEKNLIPGQTALFAGVNFGLHLILASKLVSENGHVIGVEPQPRSIYRAYQNILLNTLHQNIHLIISALGSTSDLIPMGDAPNHNSGSASLIIENDYSAPFYVHVVTLSTLLSKLGVQQVDMMLLDVEGYEINVLRGIERKHRPFIMIVEAHPLVLNKLSISQVDVFDMLEALDYTCFSVDGLPVRERYPLPENNIVAVLQGVKLPQFIKLEIKPPV